MTIATLSDLTTAIQKWTSDTTTTLSDRIPDLITLAEDRMQNGTIAPNPFPTPPLRPRILEQRATASTVASSEYLALPTDYLAMIYLKINATPDVFLDYVTPVQASRYVNNSQVMEPRVFSIVGSEIWFPGIPDTVYTIEMAYYKKIPALATNNTNDLLTASPSLYLYGCLLETYIFKGGNNDNLLKYGAMYSGVLNSLNQAQQESRLGGSLIARPETATP